MAHSLDETISIATNQARALGANEIVVMGGSEVYAQTLSIAKRFYLTEIDADIQGDVYFPKYDRTSWRQVELEQPMKTELDSHAYQFFVLER